MKTNNKIIPSYNDGMMHLYQIYEEIDLNKFPLEKLYDENMDICFLEISIGDRIKNELKQNGIEVSTKVRIPQFKKINSKSVVKINDEYHRVNNVYHFTSKDGFLETDLTLVKYEKKGENL